jgi:HD-like signal output (HDOD) protein
MDELTSRISKLPPIPAFLMRLLEHIDDPAVDIIRLVEDVSHDQVLAMRVLRVANSSFFGMPARVSSIKDAVHLIGTANLRSLALAAGLMRHLPTRVGIGFDYRAFWKHGLGTALNARALAARANHEDGTAFTAGLLHDIGELILATCAPESYRQVAAARAHERPLVDTERELLGFDHALVGYELARQWRFPHAIQIAIHYHHVPNDPPHAALTDLVHIACAYCPPSMQGLMTPQVPVVSQQALLRLDLAPDAVAQCVAAAEEELANAIHLIDA